MALRAVASLLLLSYWPLGWAEQDLSPEPQTPHAPLLLSCWQSLEPRVLSSQGPWASLRGLPRAPPGSRDHLLSLEMTLVSQGPQTVSLTRENPFLLCNFTMAQKEPSTKGDEVGEVWRWVASYKQ